MASVMTLARGHVVLLGVWGVDRWRSTSRQPFQDGAGRPKVVDGDDAEKAVTNHGKTSDVNTVIKP